MCTLIFLRKEEGIMNKQIEFKLNESNRIDVRRENPNRQSREE